MKAGFGKCDITPRVGVELYGFYSREELDMFRHNQLSSFSAFNCSAHLSVCKECSKIMEELAEDDCFIADLCGSIQFFREFSENL